MAKKRKYGNTKCTYDGMVFDSKAEMMRYKQLKALEEAGEIKWLACQVKFMLMPAQYEQSNEVYKKGPRKGQKKRGKLIEKECAYYADFVYYESNSNKMLVEDVKGKKTKEYIIKRKLMYWLYGIRIKEVKVK